MCCCGLLVCQQAATPPPPVPSSGKVSQITVAAVGKAQVVPVAKTTQSSVTSQIAAAQPKIQPLTVVLGRERHWVASPTHSTSSQDSAAIPPADQQIRSAFFRKEVKRRRYFKGMTYSLGTRKKKPKPKVKAPSPTGKIAASGEFD